MPGCRQRYLKPPATQQQQQQTIKDDADTNKKTGKHLASKSGLILPSDWSRRPCQHQIANRRNKAQAQSEDYYYDYHKQYAPRTNKMVSLSDYPKHQLLLQNQGILARHGRITPLARGAAILYQVKERHVLENRIRAWVIVVAINPVNGLKVLLTEGGTRKVMPRYWSGKKVRYIVFYYCIYCIV
jgi:hypothetical protein